MFKATKAFKNSVTSHPKEPTLRIGKCVPENAVNLAYYYNPTATDAEKVLTADAPRNTIDHRVEEAYRYLFNQASDDDDLFPGSVLYEDEEGYSGQLGRMYVHWYPEAHVSTKNIQQTKDVLLINKSETPKMIEYIDDAGYSGNLYLDAVDYTVTRTKDESTVEILDREVFDHELNYHEIFGSYISPSNLDMWTQSPTSTNDSLWPTNIVVGAYLQASGGNQTVRRFVDSKISPYDDATGVLQFSSIKYEPVFLSPPISAEVKDYNISSTFLNKEEKAPLEEMTVDKAYEIFKPVYESHFDPLTNEYEYSEIEDFLTMAEKYCNNQNALFFTRIRKGMEENNDIAIYMDSLEVVPEAIEPNADAWFKVKYKYSISTKAAFGGTQYNVTVSYSGMLKKTVTTIREVPAEYQATCNFTGIVRKVWHDYDGVAYYRGAVTKGNGIGNVNPEANNEILMFSDDDGYLRRPVEVTDDNGEVTTKNFYRIEADYIYLTDVFKDGEACFYKYPLKLPIYDYRGPDDYGFYEGDTVKLCTSNYKNIPKNYKYNMKLSVAEYETVSDITNDFQLTSKEVPKKYIAELYTSFVSSSTDTFKVIYNAFNDSETDNIALDNGVTEDVYNYPFMIKDRDFMLESVDVRARVNKIKLPEAKRIQDTRRYITFTYTITAERKSDGRIFTTSPRTASILNKDYAVAVEYNKFEDRAMIISPKVNGIYLSPMDLVLHDQAAERIETIITAKDTDFVFTATITDIASFDRGAVNIKCNADGSGTITAETTIDTGFWDERNGTYTKKLYLENPYHIENGYIYPGFKVKCIDSRHIKVQSPRQDGLLESWYPRIQFGHYSQILDQYGTHIKVCYTMPEYDAQHYSDKYGQPYVDVVEEKVTILNSHMVKTQCFPLFIKENETTISLFKKLDNELFEIHIKDISFSDGIIITKETISENDNIICNYTYIEESYVYRGFWRNANDFARIDLNPNKYHTYSDLSFTPSETKPSKNLFNKVIYFFMRPTVEYEVDASNDSLIYDLENDEDIGKVLLENKDTLYHQIDNNQPESDHDIYIGSVYIRQNTSLKSTVLVDSRTRGGGVIESMKDSIRKQLEPESDYYLDIGYYDGEPYQENGVIIVRLDNRLLKEFGGRFTQSDIEIKVKRWLGLGVYPIIEYVDTYSKKDMPQYNLIIENSYTNITDETPEILLECIEIS